jgi:uncharacterized protein YjfI (DUF2170 family)
MLGFEAVMEIEFNDFGGVDVTVDVDPQPVTDSKTIGRAKKINLTRQHNAFMLASRRLLKSLSNA